jgi:hypothetical protein
LIRTANRQSKNIAASFVGSWSKLAASAAFSGLLLPNSWQRKLWRLLGYTHLSFWWLVFGHGTCPDNDPRISSVPLKMTRLRKEAGTTSDLDEKAASD